MGGGDLNLKKSWHTGLLSNQRKVWEAEQAALAERKKIEQVKREREEEAQIEELARLAEANGGTKRTTRVEWMYGGSSSGVMGTTEEQESYLLGKRRVDNLLKKDDDLQKEKVQKVQADPVKDITNKVMLDPLLLIEKQRQEAIEKAAALQAKMAERESRRSKSRREKDRSSRHRDGRDRRDGDNRRHRSRSPRRPGSDSRRDRSRSRERKRARSPESETDRIHRRHRQRTRSLDWERSPRRSDHRQSHSHRRDNEHGADRRRNDDRGGDRRRDYGRQSQPSRTQIPDEDREAEKAAKLAAMQADASSLEVDRARRLEAMEQQDVIDREQEEKKRNRSGANFKSQMYQQTEGVGLAGRLKGSRGLLST